MATQPTNLFTTLFAADGDKTIIPTASTEGRAGLDLGFPPATAIPLSTGGLAPRRTDFNGLFYMLSAFAFYQQSGGIFGYLETVDYDTPAFVYDATSSAYYFCKKSNGPGTTAGVQKPSEDTDRTYWELFVNGQSVVGYQPGDIKMYGAASAPAGFLECNGAEVSRTTYAALFAAIGTTWGSGNGSTTFTLPDLRGRVPRGWDHGAGVDAARVFGSYQADALGSHTHDLSTGTAASAGGHTHSATTASAGTHTHSVSGTAAEAGSHSHSVSASSSTAGDHVHALSSGTVSTVGDHTHVASGSTSTNGEHTHTYNGSSPYEGDIPSIVAYGAQAVRYASSSAGSHSHTFAVATTGSGSHTHSLGGNSASAGSHTHTISVSVGAGGSHTHTVTGTADNAGAHTHTVTVASSGAHTHSLSGNTGATGTGETRMKNVAVLYCIKY